MSETFFRIKSGDSTDLLRVNSDKEAKATITLTASSAGYYALADRTSSLDVGPTKNIKIGYSQPLFNERFNYTDLNTSRYKMYNMSGSTIVSGALTFDPAGEEEYIQSQQTFKLEPNNEYIFEAEVLFQTGSFNDTGYKFGLGVWSDTYRNSGMSGVSFEARSDGLYYNVSYGISSAADVPNVVRAKIGNITTGSFSSYKISFTREKIKFFTGSLDVPAAEVNTPASFDYNENIIVYKEFRRYERLGSGLNNICYALASASDGIYAGGNFGTAGGSSANYIAKWNGANWSALGTGLGSTCYSLISASDGIYAGGNFATAGGNSANYIAKWDGTSWSALGTGLNDTCYALISASDGIYAGGFFTTASGVANTSRIAKWNGTSWSALGSGLGSNCFALLSASDGIYAGGQFTTAGGSSASRIAKWNGTSWSAVGTGLGDTCRALLSASDGVYAGGFFTTAGGNSANYIAKWNGTSWSALGTGLAGGCWALLSGSDGIYAAGQFNTAGGSSANGIAKWNGSSWSALGTGFGVPGFCYALISASDGIYAGGNFATAGGNSANNIAKYNTITPSTNNIQVKNINLTKIGTNSERLNPSIISRPENQSPNQISDYSNNNSASLSILSNTTCSKADNLLHGQWQFESPSGSETDYTLFSYLNRSDKNLYVQGMNVDTAYQGNFGAISSSLLQWSLSTSKVQNDLSTYRNIPVGIQAIPSGSPVGYSAKGINIKFDNPILVESGSYLNTILKIPVGYQDTGSIIRGSTYINSYWD